MGKREGKIGERKERREKGTDFRERCSNFSLNFSAIGPLFPTRQKVKLLPTERATCGYHFCGVSTTLGGRGLLLLGLFFGLRALLMVWVV